MNSTVTVSPKFQIVIPQDVRARMGVKPGQKITFVEWRGTFALVPVLDADSAHGFLKNVEPQPDKVSANDADAREKDFGEE